jgi:hypothetical protein
MGILGRKGEHWYKSGTEFTSDCFVLDNLLFYRKKKGEFWTCPIGDWEGAPVSVREVYSSEFFIYNMAEKTTTVIQGIQFYRAMTIRRENGGTSKADEQYVYDKIMDDDFVMYCLIKSDLI